MKKEEKRIRIVSLPRMTRLKKTIGDHFGSRIYSVHFIGQFSPLANKFTHHPDGGEAMYREWIRSVLEDANGPVFNEISLMWNRYHHSTDRQYTLIFITNCECNPVPINGIILRDFIESMGKKL